MNWEWISYAAVALAALPAALFVMNLFYYRRLPPVPQNASGNHVAPMPPLPPVSILIPARDEERNIVATLEAVLANRGVEFEVVVLDDHSQDRTAALVRAIASRDSRVRLATAPLLPDGWCGKQHACHVLAQQAAHPWLIFLDADVRLSPDAIERLLFFMARRGDVALASGVPWQETGSWSERLLLPLIHFVLLGFLPMVGMRYSRRPAFSAGCGQLFIARAEAYRAVGGHGSIRDSLHDGVKLPRAFRRRGFKTELFDATDIARCRMYQSNRETWQGLGKNATEGLGAPAIIGPMTILLLGGQVLPFVLLAGWLLAGVAVGLSAWTALGAALGLAYLPRWLGAIWFRQPWWSVWLHPLGILGLVALQWMALGRHIAGRSAVWKGRRYGPSNRRPTPRMA
jgi:hypothetical protein